MPPQVSIVAYIDADDQMSSRRLEVMVRLMRQHGAHLGLHSHTEVHAHQQTHSNTHSNPDVASPSPSLWPWP